MEKGGDLWDLFQYGLDSCQTAEQNQNLRSDLEDTLRNGIARNNAEIERKMFYQQILCFNTRTLGRYGNVMRRDASEDLKDNNIVIAIDYL